jgi:hypothetical protein
VANVFDKESSAKPSYLRAMLTHQYNQYALLSSAAFGALLAIPYGLNAGVMPVLAYGAGAALASLFIPSHPKFKQWVDNRHRTRQRERSRSHLESEISRRATPDNSLWAAYHRMRERVTSLRGMASSRKNISSREIDRLDDATVNFLGLWLAHLVIDEREASIDEGAVQQRIDSVEAQIAAASSAADRRRLSRAKQDLERVLERRERMHTRRATVDAAMLSMSDAFDEVYQGVIANPTGDIASQLHNAVERMNLEEELGSEIEEELGDVLPGRAAASRASVRAG